MSFPLLTFSQKCLELNNFSTLFGLLAGLNGSIIQRLKKTWDALNPKYLRMFERLKEVIEHTKNHDVYRQRLRKVPVSTPCLPYLGLMLSDITFTLDGNPNTRPSTSNPDLKLINQDKFTKLARITADFRSYQERFNLREIEPIQQYLSHVLAERGSGSLDALYEKSLMLEPRQDTEKQQLASAVEKPSWLGASIDRGGVRARRNRAGA
jgi:hypothetical protein